MFHDETVDDIKDVIDIMRLLLHCFGDYDHWCWLLISETAMKIIQHQEVDSECLWHPLYHLLFLLFFFDLRLLITALVSSNFLPLLIEFSVLMLVMISLSILEDVVSPSRNQWFFRSLKCWYMYINRCGSPGMLPGSIWKM